MLAKQKNPGPGDEHCVTLAVCNPNAVHGKIKQLVSLNADVICVSETSATSVIQKEASTELSKLGFKSFWSEPVAPKKATLDNRPSFRGEAVGAAVFSSVPARQFRGDIPVVLKESQRFSACIIRLGSFEILVIALYGFANRHREVKRPNDLLLASIIPLICSTGLPFLVCGDLMNRFTSCRPIDFSKTWERWKPFSGTKPRRVGTFHLPVQDPLGMTQPYASLWRRFSHGRAGSFR
jgi:hypothetical protein